VRRQDGPPPTDLTQLVEATRHRVANPRFKAVLEAWLAMANDPDLRREIGPVDRDRDRYLMARETMLGLALGRATNRGRALPHEDAVLAQLRRAVERPRTTG
jgi:hypothetical protein